MDPLPAGTVVLGLGAVVFEFRSVGILCTVCASCVCPEDRFGPLCSLRRRYQYVAVAVGTGRVIWPFFSRFL